MMLDAELKSRILQAGQTHVLRFWDDLTTEKQTQFAQQLAAVDWESLKGMIQSIQDASQQPPVDLSGRIQPASLVVRSPKSSAEKAAMESAHRCGADSLSSGKVAAILLAGGQGTRLGFPHPKGMFPIGPVSRKSLFALFAAQIQALSSRFGRSISYLIMTSDGTHQETESFFQQNNYFGLNPNDLFLFQQGYVPAIDLKSGKLLLADKGALSLSPDGHGGLVAALHKAGLFEVLRRRGVEYLYSHQVDNPLSKVCDPTFVGLHIQHRADVSTKVVSKTSPEERVGVAVDVDGKTQIIEYSDLPPSVAQERTDAGELRIWAGSTAIHLFNLAFLEQIAISANANLPWHRAIKKIPCIDEAGNPIVSEVENGIKFERFIFDTLPLAKMALIVETPRDEEFAPLKNKEGDFSAEYVRDRIKSFAKRRLRAAGIKLHDQAIVEIDPRFALTDEDLAARRTEIEQRSFDHPVYLCSDALSSAETLTAATPLNDPIVFEPFYRPQVWGGRSFQTVLGRNLPLEGPYGESWEISPQALHTSRVCEGSYTGSTINELWMNHRQAMAGRNAMQFVDVEMFPLLVKWLECRELLSLQVHPDDEMARRTLNEPFGKSEAWIVIAAEPTARVYAGLKPGVSHEDFLTQLNRGTLIECVHSFVPRPGDCISIPAGTIHAAGGGILIAEVQQSSDATFRVFDWNRMGLDGKPRELHIERAMEAICWDQGPVLPIVPTEIPLGSSGIRAEQLVDGNGFQLERYSISQPMTTPHAGELTIWMVLGGCGELTNPLTGYQRELKWGSSILIPGASRGTVWTPKDPRETLTLLGVRLNTIGIQNK